MRFLVLDYGGTFVKYSVMDENKQMYEKGEVPAPIDTLEHFKEVLNELYAPFKGTVEGVTVSFPGFIEAGTNRLTGGGAYLSILKDMSLTEVFSEIIDVPVIVENDGKCGALAEAWGGALEGAHSGIVYIIGTGIAGGLLLDGKLVRGVHGTAGELSYTTSDWSMNPLQAAQFHCTASALVAKVCIAKGMPLTNFASLYEATGVAATWKHGEPDPALEGVEMDGRKVFELLEAGDPDVVEIYDQFCKDIAGVLVNLQIVYDPEFIAIGGGISRQERLVRDIENALPHAMQGLLAMLPKPQLVRCHYQSDANQYGAVYNYLVNYHPDMLK